jgi:hypothetical protein
VDAGVLTRKLLGVLLSPGGFGLVTALLPWLFPFSIEAYLAFHYRKTREQTLGLLELFAEDADRQSLPSGAIRRLLNGLRGS